jgi:hypothetical protein
LSAPVTPSARGLTSTDAIVIVRAFKRDFHPRGCCPCTHGPSRHGSIRRRCHELAQTRHAPSVARCSAGCVLARLAAVSSPPVPRAAAPQQWLGTHSAISACVCWYLDFNACDSDKGDSPLGLMPRGRIILHGVDAVPLVLHLQEHPCARRESSYEQPATTVPE